MPKRVSHSKVWEHYTPLPEKNVNRCNHCNSKFSKSSSTSNLWLHLEKNHGISRTSLAPSNVNHTESGEPSNVNQTESREPSNVAEKTKTTPKNSIREIIAKNSKQLKIQSSIKKHITFEERVARLAAVDRFSFRQIAQSRFIQDALEMMYQRKVSCHKTVRKIVKKYAAKKRLELKEKFKEQTSCNKRFSFTCDEFTSSKNTRFMTVNVHGAGQFWNLGMVHVPKSLKSEAARDLVTKRLQEFCIGKFFTVSVKTRVMIYSVEMTRHYLNFRETENIS